MMVRAARWLYQRMGHRYYFAYLGFEFGSALTIALATVRIFSLYQRISTTHLHVIAAFAWGCVLLALLAGAKKVYRCSAPLRRWHCGEHVDAAAVAASPAWWSAVSPTTTAGTSARSASTSPWPWWWPSRSRSS